VLSTGRGRLVVALGVTAILAALAVPTLAFIRLMTPSEPTVASQSELARAHVGGQITAVVRIDGQSGDGTFTATFLQLSGSNAYQVTSARVRIRLAGDTSYAMGDAASVKQGAVLQVKGVLSAADEITVREVVALTGFVTVRS
jgi:hypothetical protein